MMLVVVMLLIVYIVDIYTTDCRQCYGYVDVYINIVHAYTYMYIHVHVRTSKS